MSTAKSIRCPSCHEVIAPKTCACCGIISYPDKCPICKTALDRYAMSQDQCSSYVSELFSGCSKRMGRALKEYLTLFRPDKNMLSHCRALDILESTLALEKNEETLILAITQAVNEARARMRNARWDQPKAGKEHGWLRTFLKNVQVNGDTQKGKDERVVTEDVPAEEVRARAERQPGMPENIKAHWEETLNRLKGVRSETDEQRENRLQKSREAAEDAVRRSGGVA